jgi:mono/diheme cytochrome c family protein
MRPAGALLLGGLSFLAAGASAPAGPPKPPRLLSQTGLYRGPAREVDPRHLAYSPQYPLWTDGAAKSRWVFLPAGARIDVRDVDSWVVPPGAKFWKEFGFAGKKVETRFIWRATSKSWVFATYLWNDEQTDAELAPADGVAGYVEIAPGKRHTIPGVSDCTNCHEDERSPLLGFNALQLSTDRDPLAPHAEPLTPGMVTLRTLLDRGLLRPARKELLESPPRIRSATPRARALLGYFTANCGSCHRATGSLAPLGLDFSHPESARDEAAEPGFATTVARTGKWEVPGAAPGETRRIEPGALEKSSVLYRMRSRHATTQMPPLGSVVPDQEAIDLLERWIAEDLPGR